MDRETAAQQFETIRRNYNDQAEVVAKLKDRRAQALGSLYDELTALVDRLEKAEDDWLDNPEYLAKAAEVDQAESAFDEANNYTRAKDLLSAREWDLAAAAIEVLKANGFEKRIEEQGVGLGFLARLRRYPNRTYWRKFLACLLDFDPRKGGLSILSGITSK